MLPSVLSVLLLSAAPGVSTCASESIHTAQQEPAAGGLNREEVELFRQSKVTLSEAIAAAKNHGAGQLVEASFDISNGKPVYKVNTFQNNAYIFNKVYFPRLIVPLSSILFHSFRISIQLLLFLGVCLFYVMKGTSLHLSWQILLVPLIIFITACFALGCGLIISVLTAKYRDLDNIMQFMLRLFMFAAPVVYPASLIPVKYKFLFWLNPLTPVIEIFRSSFFKPEPLPFSFLLLSLLTTSIVLMTGIILFNKREIQIMDVI